MKEKIKVLTVTNVYPTETTPGAPIIRDQLDILREKGVAVDLITIDGDNKVNYLKALWQVFLLNFRKKKYDLVHAYYGHSGLISRFQWRSPVVVTFLGSDLLDHRDALIGRFIAGKVDSVIVMTEEMKRASGREDAEVIPFGVNKEIFKPYPLNEARKELNLDMEKKYVLFPYNPNRKVKRFDIVSGAVSVLQEKGFDIEILSIFNKTPQEIARYMNAVNGFILASDSEGSPLAIREALACCLPIVSVDVGDVKDLIINVDQCYITKQNVVDIAEAFEKIILSNRRIDINTQPNIDIKYSTDKVLNIYKKFFSP